MQLVHFMVISFYMVIVITMLSAISSFYGNIPSKQFACTWECPPSAMHDISGVDHTTIIVILIAIMHNY